MNDGQFKTHMRNKKGDLVGEQSNFPFMHTCPWGLR